MPGDDVLCKVGWDRFKWQDILRAGLVTAQCISRPEEKVGTVRTGARQWLPCRDFLRSLKWSRGYLRDNHDMQKKGVGGLLEYKCSFSLSGQSAYPNRPLKEDQVHYW